MYSCNISVFISGKKLFYIFWSLCIFQISYATPERFALTFGKLSLENVKVMLREDNIVSEKTFRDILFFYKDFKQGVGSLVEFLPFVSSERGTMTAEKANQATKDGEKRIRDDGGDDIQRSLLKAALWGFLGFLFGSGFWLRKPSLTLPNVKDEPQLCLARGVRKHDT